MQNLNEYLRARIAEKHKTIVAAADAFGIPYERLKKALQINRFSKSDLDSIQLGLGEKNFGKGGERFEFTVSESYTRSAPEPGLPRPGTHDDFLEAIEPLFHSHKGLKSLARGNELSPVVSKLYESWLDGMLMVLFCEEDFEPLEWTARNTEVRANLRKALRSGGIVIYVFEGSDELTGEENDMKSVTRRFNSFVSKMKTECSEDGLDEYPGFVALLILPHCPFCVPHQKPTLVSIGDDDLGTNIPLAFLGLDVPDTKDGYANSVTGSIIIPQKNEVAQRMSRFLDEFTTYAEEIDYEIPGFQVQCFPEKKPAEVLRLMRGLL